MQIKQSQFRIARSLTPLPSKTYEEDCEALRFLAKLESLAGKPGNIAFSVSVEDEVFLWGPAVEYIFSSEGNRQDALHCLRHGDWSRAAIGCQLARIRDGDILCGAEQSGNGEWRWRD